MYEVKIVSDFNENELWGVMFTLDQIVGIYISRTPADPPRTPREKVYSFQSRGPPEDPRENLYRYNLII